MFTYIAENLGTIVVGLALLIVVSLIVAGMVRKRGSGKPSCGCGCSGCPSAGICHDKE